MGRTKALVEVDGVPMATRVASALRGVGCESVVAFGGVPDDLMSLDLPVLPDRYPGEGPLGGVLGVLQLFDRSATEVIIAACDLAYLLDDDLVPMVAAAREHPSADVIVATTGRREPGCAIWRVSALAEIQVLFDAGERAVHHALDRLRVIEVSVEKRGVRNINTLDDLGRYS